MDGFQERVDEIAKFRGRSRTSTFQWVMSSKASLVDESVIEATFQWAMSQWGVTKAELVGPRRFQPLAKQRQVCMVVLRDLTMLSLTEIGEIFNRDHTTILHAYRALARERSESPAFEADYVRFLKRTFAAATMAHGPRRARE